MSMVSLKAKAVPPQQFGADSSSLTLLGCETVRDLLTNMVFNLNFNAATGYRLSRAGSASARSRPLDRATRLGTPTISCEIGNRLDQLFLSRQSMHHGNGNAVNQNCGWTVRRRSECV